MPVKTYALLVLFVSASLRSSLQGQDPQIPAPILAKTANNAAAGRLNAWELGGADSTFKAAKAELWVLDPFSDAVPFITAFNIADLMAAPRRIPITLPVDLAEAPALGIAEVPHGEFQGKNLILIDPSFGTQNTPAPALGIFDDDGNLESPDAIFPIQGVPENARLSSIDVNPEREEIVVYDSRSHAIYVLSFEFAVLQGPIPLAGLPQFFARPWFFNNSSRGGGMGLAWNGPDKVLATAGFVNAFDAHFILEYDLTLEGAYSGRAIDLGAAALAGSRPDTAFGSLDMGNVGVDEALFSLNFSDESIYAFGPLLQPHAPAVASLSCEISPETPGYMLQWTLDPAADVDSIRILENGVEVATLDRTATSHVSPFPFLGKLFLEVVPEKGGLLSGFRPVCQLENSDQPGIEGVTNDGVEVTNLGLLFGVAVTKTPATPADFRTYLIGSDRNAVEVFDHTLEAIETFSLNPPVVTQGTNGAAMGIAILELNGRDHLAVLDNDGPTGSGPPSAGVYGIEGADKGQLVLDLPLVDLRALSPVPELLDWDADASNDLVAAGVMFPGGVREFVIVKIEFDGLSLVASQMVPVPQRVLTPFASVRFVGIGVSVLPSGNILVAGSDTFSRTYTEALLATPLDGNPATSGKLVGYAQGLLVPNQFFSNFGPGLGPATISGFDTAWFPPGGDRTEGVGVTYLTANHIFLVQNPSIPDSLIFPFLGLLHRDNSVSDPGLVAEQLAEAELQVPPAQSQGTAELSPSFAGRVDSSTYYVYVINGSTEAPSDIALEVKLDGVAVAEAAQEVVLPAGRYHRAVLEERTETRIQVTARNLGSAPASLKIIAGASGIAAGPLNDRFRRGDCDGDGLPRITDAIFGLDWLFRGGTTPSCADACDGDDNGETNVTDMIFILNHLFQGGPVPPDPGPDVCGPDPTTDDPLGACTYSPDAC